MAKSYKMTKEEIHAFLAEAPVGRFSTIDAEGFPYTIAVNFVYLNDKIYIHGKGKGQKINNLLANAKVGFEIDELYRFIDENLKMPCEIYANYRSVMLKGQASLAADLAEKRLVLAKFVDKYLPSMENKSMPDKAIEVTAVIQIDVAEVSGKKHE